MSDCIDGNTFHNEIITPDDDDGRYDPEVFAHYDDFVPPNSHQWGYCLSCRQTFRWSVRRQQWVEWPGGVAKLPQLTSEELEVLGSAINGERASIEAGLVLSQAPGMQVELKYRWLILESLATAVAEAQHGIRDRTSPDITDAGGRRWRSEWAGVSEWVQVQIDGIQRHTMPDASLGALAAFQAMQKKLASLIEPNPETARAVGRMGFSGNLRVHPPGPELPTHG